MVRKPLRGKLLSEPEINTYRHVTWIEEKVYLYIP